MQWSTDQAQQAEDAKLIWKLKVSMAGYQGVPLLKAGQGLPACLRPEQSVRNAHCARTAGRRRRSWQCPRLRRPSSTAAQAQQVPAVDRV